MTNTTKKTQEMAVLKMSEGRPKLCFDLFKYVNQNTPSDYSCSEHGPQRDCYKNITRTKYGCVGCATSGPNAKIQTEEASRKLKEVYKDCFDYYDWSRFVLQGMRSKATILCPDHGEVIVRAVTLLSRPRRTPCKWCNIAIRSEDQVDTKETFLEKYNQVTEYNFCFDRMNYVSSKERVDVGCTECGVYFQMRPNDLMSGRGCPNCADVGTSKAQKEILEFVKSLGVSAVDRHRLGNGKEVDILLPDCNIAIEYNGLYWHSEEFIPKDYHFCKRQYCEENGLQLIQIFEDEWVHKRHAVEAYILRTIPTGTPLSLADNEVGYVQDSELSEFLTQYSLNTIQDQHTVCIGLRSNGNLVSVMLVQESCEASTGLKIYSIVNYVSSLQVDGTISTLIDFLTKSREDCKVIALSDRRLIDCDDLRNIGFTKLGTEPPTLWYTLGQRRYTQSDYYSLHADAGRHKEPTPAHRVWDAGRDLWQLNCV